MVSSLIFLPFIHGFSISIFLFFFPFLLHTMDFFSSFFIFFIFVFYHNCLFPCAFLFEMGIGLNIFCKSKSLSTCENWHFNPSLSTSPFNSTQFHAFQKPKNVLLLATTLWRSIKPAMQTLELVKSEGANVLSTMSSKHGTFFIFTKFD